MRYISRLLMFGPDPSVTTFWHEQSSSRTTQRLGRFWIQLGKQWLYAKLHGRVHFFAAIE